jgi:hypothetical protein
MVLNLYIIKIIKNLYRLFKIFKKYLIKDAIDTHFEKEVNLSCGLRNSRKNAAI